MWYFTRILAQLKLIGGHFVSIGRLVWSYSRTHPLIAGATLGLVVAGVGALFYFTASESPTELDESREVTIVRVGDLSTAEPLSVVGDIRAAKEALIAADASGAVSAVYRSLGDFVGAGTIIAELKNDGQRAAVAQATVALEKARSGATVGDIGVESAQTAFTSALEGARTATQSAYATVNDAVQKKADEVFSNPESNTPHFIVSSSNSQAVRDAENKRGAMQAILARHASVGNVPLDDAILLAELNTLLTETAAVRDFLTNVVTALNSAIATGGVTDTAIAGYRTDASTALTSINALRATINTTIENIKSKRAAVTIARENLSQNATGENADVRAAEANLASARANLEKTFIRAPISGAINRLDLEVGSFVSPGVPVVYITNQGGLEAVVFVSEKDIRDIVVGAKAVIGGVIEGAVIRVAKALDPVTKKAEMRIAIPAGAPFVAGQSASIAITRTRAAGQIGPLSIPLSALKITPEGPVVFTVSSDGILNAHLVALGTLRGSSTEIKDGLTIDMEIVKDARGLKDGQKVIVNSGAGIQSFE